MRFAIEAEGTLAADPGEALSREVLQDMFERIAEALVQFNELEADVAINFGTRDLQFFVVVEASNPKDAVGMADSVINKALESAGVTQPLDWDQLHARRADLIPA